MMKNTSDSNRYTKFRTAGKIISFIAFPLLGLLGLVYVIINLRMLFAGDFNAYSSPLSGAFGMIFTVINGLFLIFYAVATLVHHLKKEDKKDTTFILILSVAYILIALVNSFFFAFNKGNGVMAYIDIATLFLYVLGLVGLFFYFVFDYHTKKLENEEGEISEEPIENIEAPKEETKEDL